MEVWCYFINDSEPFEDEIYEVSGSFGLLMRMKLRQKTLSSRLMDARQRGVLCQAVGDDQVGVIQDWDEM